MDYKRLGKYIREVNVRNKDLKVTNLQGVSISKQFIPSIANTIGTDMSTYKVVNPGQFAYGPVTSRNGDKVSIALYKGDDDAIISQAYTVFEVVDMDKMSSDYLMMWFQRPEFDRYARFHSHGSAREIFDWDELCGVYLPLPDIDRQREIVEEYETLSRRIRLNEQMIEKLEATAQALYCKMFVDGIDKDSLPEGWRMGTLGEFGNVITGKTPSSDNPEDFGATIPFVTPGDFQTYKKFAIGAERMLSEIGEQRLKGKVLPIGSVIVTCIGSDMGKVAVASENCITNQQMNSIVLTHSEDSDFLFYFLTSISVEMKAMALGSSTMPLLNKSDFEMIGIPIPPRNMLIEFAQLLRGINKKMVLKLKENSKLSELQSLLLAKMGNLKQ
jgi:type I restriction enzyme S subunit